MLASDFSSWLLFEILKYIVLLAKRLFSLSIAWKVRKEWGQRCYLHNSLVHQNEIYWLSVLKET